MSDRVQKAKELAYKVHADQTDKSGAPYIEHVSRVAEAVKELGEDYEIVAWLHDVCEDSDMQPYELGPLFGAHISSAVHALTKKPNESYLGYIEQLTAYPLALEVKRRDLADNLDPDRLSLLPDKDRMRLEMKYLGAIDLIEKAKL